MKKCLCWLLVMVLTLGMIPFASADTATNTFPVSFLPAMNMNPKEWCADEESRAMFTILLLVEYILQVDDTFFEKTQLTNTSYVGRKDLMVTLMLQLNDKSWMLFGYSPYSNDSEVEYESLGTLSKATIELGLPTIMDVFYENDIIDLYEVYNELNSAFTN